MLVRACTARDLEVLESAYPSPGTSRYHEQRFLRQQQKISTFLTAWDEDGVSIGACEILWTGAKEPEVAARIPGCPELNGLTVWPQERRSRGIGTHLIRHAEALARERGCLRIGLGVAADNPRAADLYLRLGYAESGVTYLDRYFATDAAGNRRDFADPCRFLVKTL